MTQKPFFTEYVPRDIIGQITGAYNSFLAVSRMLALGLGLMLVKAMGNYYRMIWAVGLVMGSVTVAVSLSIPDRRYEERKRASAMK